MSAAWYYSCIWCCRTLLNLRNRSATCFRFWQRDIFLDFLRIQCCLNGNRVINLLCSKRQISWMHYLGQGSFACGLRGPGEIMSALQDPHQTHWSTYLVIQYLGIIESEYKAKSCCGNGDPLTNRKSTMPCLIGSAGKSAPHFLHPRPRCPALEKAVTDHIT